MLGETHLLHGQTKIRTVPSESHSDPKPEKTKTCISPAFDSPKTKQSIIDLVAADFKDGQYLSDQEFTDRYMVLMKAYRKGVIDEQMRVEGLEFLLDHWDYAKQNRPQ